MPKLTIQIKNVLYKSFFLFFPLLSFSQHIGDKIEKTQEYKKAPKKVNFNYSNQVFTYCDTDTDGFLALNLDDIKSYVLSNTSNQFGIDEGIYIYVPRIVKFF